MAASTPGGIGPVPAEAPPIEEDEFALDWSDADRPARKGPSEDEVGEGAAGREGAAVPDPEAPLVSPAEVRAITGSGRVGEVGIQALLGRSNVRAERLPMLEVVFDRLQRLLASSLRGLASESPELRPEPIRSLRFGEYLAALERPAQIALFRAVEWDGLGLLRVDRALTDAIVELLLGGGRSGSPARGVGRPCTAIEAILIERLARIVIGDLMRAFAPIAAVELRLDGFETDPRFAAVTRPGNACVLMRLAVLFRDRGGNLEILLPYSTLEPAREALLQGFLGERLGRDPVWERHLAREILETEVELEAVLDEQSVPLRRLLELERGTFLPLEVKPDGPVLLRCAGVPMLRGRLGRVGDRVSIRIEERLGRGGDD